MFLIIVAVNEIDNYIEKSPRHYSCPTYCKVEHEHISKYKEIKNEYTEIDSGLFVQSEE